MKKLLLMIAGLLLLLFAACTNTADNMNSADSRVVFENSVTGYATAPEGLTITAFSVGKADSLLLQADGHAMLIDTGEAEDEALLLSELNSRGISSLDILLITHFDKDHVGSAAAIVQDLEIGTVLYPDYEGEREEYDAFMASIAGHPDACALNTETQLTLGSATLTIWPAEEPEAYLKQKEYDNELSLVTRLQYGSRSFLFCGDVEGDRLEELLASGTDWQCDWIKLPHHGVYEKQLKSFLKAASPLYAVITDSDAEPADDKTLSCLEKLGTAVFRTSEGTVVTTCDGESITVTVGEAGV